MGSFSAAKTVRSHLFCSVGMYQIVLLCVGMEECWAFLGPKHHLLACRVLRLHAHLFRFAAKTALPDAHSPKSISNRNDTSATGQVVLLIVLWTFQRGRQAVSVRQSSYAGSRRPCVESYLLMDDRLLSIQKRAFRWLSPQSLTWNVK